MKRRDARGGVELSILPHSARTGWEVVRLNYDRHNPQHLAQVEAALTALVQARARTVRQSAPESAGAGV